MKKKMLIHNQKLLLNSDKKGSRSNEVKTDPPCLLRNLRGPAPGHPEVYRVNPDLPRPPKRRGPVSGSPGWDPVLDTLV